jgi:hypothetical protein
MTPRSETPGTRPLKSALFGNLNDGSNASGVSGASVSRRGQRGQSGKQGRGRRGGGPSVNLQDTQGSGSRGSWTSLASLDDRGRGDVTGDADRIVDRGRSGRSMGFDGASDDGGPPPRTPQQTQQSRPPSRTLRGGQLTGQHPERTLARCPQN